MEQIQTDITVEQMNHAGEIIKSIRDYYSSKMVGQERLGLSLLVSMIANGHILLESVPGLAKTTAAKVVTEAVNGNFSRIQCTPDLLPSDIIGTQTFNMSNNRNKTKDAIKSMLKGLMIQKSDCILSSPLILSCRDDFTINHSLSEEGL